MTEEYVIDFERLLAPISEDRPCENDLRLDRKADSLFSRLKEWHYEARSKEQTQVWRAITVHALGWRSGEIGYRKLI